MNIKIENNKIELGNISALTNRTIYVVPDSKDSVTFILNDNIKQTAKVSQTTVNGIQMTPDNIDELLSSLFSSTGGSGNDISLPINISDVDGLQEILDSIPESITLESAVSAVRLDTIKLWNSSILVLDSLINEKYGTLRANPFILASYKTTLDTQAKAIQSSLTYLKNRMTAALSAENITDTDYNNIKTDYANLVQSLIAYKKKEYEIEQNVLINQSANPSAISGTLISGGKVEVYPWMYTARLIKNTTDNFMTLSLLSRNQTRKTIFSICRNGVLTKQEIDINSNLTALFTDLGKDGNDIISISAFDKMGLRSFTIDLTVSYSTNVGDANIYALSSKYYNV